MGLTSLTLICSSLRDRNLVKDLEVLDSGCRLCIVDGDALGVNVVGGFGVESTLGDLLALRVVGDTERGVQPANDVGKLYSCIF